MTAPIAKWRLRYYGPKGQAPPGDQHAAALDIGQRSNCSSEAVFSPADGADASFRSILAPEIVGRSPQMISIGAYKKSPRRGMPSGGAKDHNKGETAHPRPVITFLRPTLGRSLGTCA